MRQLQATGVYNLTLAFMVMSGKVKQSIIARVEANKEGLFMTQLSMSAIYQKHLADAEVDKRLFEEEMQSSLLMFVYVLLAGGALCAGVMCLIMGMQLGWSPLFGLILLGGVFPPLALQLFDNIKRFNVSLQKQRQRSMNRVRK